MHAPTVKCIPGGRNKSEQYLEDDKKHTYIKKKLNVSFHSRNREK